MSDWNRYQKRHAGKGLTPRQIAGMYRQSQQHGGGAAEERTIKVLTEESARKTQEIQEYMRLLQQKDAEIDSLKTTIEVSNMKNHVHGSYSHNSPAVPTDFFTQLSGIFPSIRTYTNTIGRTLPKPVLDNLLSHLLRTLSPESDDPAADYNLTPKVLRRAALAASISRALFAHFESRTFNDYGASIPTHDKEAERKQAGREFHYITSISVAELIEYDHKFKDWADDVIGRLEQAWTPVGGDSSVYAPILQLPHFLELAKKVWALHKAVYAFPNHPEMIRFESGDVVQPTLCKSYFNEVIDVEEGIEYVVPSGDASAIVFQVVPGFLLDTTIEKAQVLWVRS